MEVAVIGAGVTGLTTAIVLAERGHVPHVFAADAAERATSGAAAAIWYPYDTGAHDAATAWALLTYARFLEICNDATSGVSLIELRSCTRAATIDVPSWAGSLGSRLLAKDELLGDFAAGYAVRVPLMDATRYLPWLRDRLSSVGGKIFTRRLDRLESIEARYKVIVNCTGYGSRALASDKQLEPHRGQSVIAAPIDLRYALVSLDEPLTYVIPRTNDCILGGVNEVSESLAIDDAGTERIVAECERLLNIPLTARDARTGLRPFRTSGVRIEACRLDDGRPVIHNYGHGGAGFTLSWGCAQSAASLLEDGRSLLRQP